VRECKVGVYSRIIPDGDNPTAAVTVQVSDSPAMGESMGGTDVICQRDCESDVAQPTSGVPSMSRLFFLRILHVPESSLIASAFRPPNQVGTYCIEKGPGISSTKAASQSPGRAA